MEDKSSASHQNIMPAANPSSSLITNSEKSGEYGDVPISTTKGSVGDTSADHTVSAPEGNDDMGKQMMPAEKPKASFINTSAVK